MNVYPVNLIQGASLTSSQKAVFSDLANIYHPYLKHRCWFDGTNPAGISCVWELPLEMDSIIVADTNAGNFEIELFNAADESVFYAPRDSHAHITIVEIPKQPIKKLLLTLNGSTEKYLGYLFAGKKVELPRFLINPEFGMELRSEAGRTNGGQAYGTMLTTLDVIKVNYERINQKEIEVINSYIQAVQNVVPHIIDTYPGARDAVPPVYATLASGITKTKRAENNFYWNFELSWQEAR